MPAPGLGISRGKGIIPERQHRCAQGTKRESQESEAHGGRRTRETAWSGCSFQGESGSDAMEGRSTGPQLLFIYLQADRQSIFNHGVPAPRLIVSVSLGLTNMRVSCPCGGYMFQSAERGWHFSGGGSPPARPEGWSLRGFSGGEDPDRTRELGETQRTWPRADLTIQHEHFLRDSLDIGLFFCKAPMSVVRITTVQPLALSSCRR